MLKFFME